MVPSFLFSAAPLIPPEESSEDGLHQPLDESKQFSIQDIFDLQDTNFTVAIQPPGTEGFDLQVRLCNW